MPFVGMDVKRALSGWNAPGAARSISPQMQYQPPQQERQPQQGYIQKPFNFQQNAPATQPQQPDPGSWANWTQAAQSSFQMPSYNAYGQQVDNNSLMQQRMNLVGQINDISSKQQVGTWLGQGQPPAGWGQTSYNPQQMWQQAGQDSLINNLGNQSGQSQYTPQPFFPDKERQEAHKRGDIQVGRRPPADDGMVMVPPQDRPPVMRPYRPDQDQPAQPRDPVADRVQQLMGQWVNNPKAQNNPRLQQQLMQQAQQQAERESRQKNAAGQQGQSPYQFYGQPISQEQFLKLRSLSREDQQRVNNAVRGGKSPAEVLGIGGSPFAQRF